MDIFSALLQIAPMRLIFYTWFGSSLTHNNNFSFLVHYLQSPINSLQTESLRKILVSVHWHMNKSQFRDSLISTYQISSVGRTWEQCPWVVSSNPTRGRSFSSHSSFSQLSNSVISVKGKGLTKIKTMLKCM